MLVPRNIVMDLNNVMHARACQLVPPWIVSSFAPHFLFNGKNSSIDGIPPEHEIHHSTLYIAEVSLLSQLHGRMSSYSPPTHTGVGHQ